MKKYFLAAALAAVLGMAALAPAQAEMEIPSKKQLNPGIVAPQPAPAPPAVKPGLDPKGLLGSWWCKCGYTGCNVVCVAIGGTIEDIIPNHNCPGNQPTPAEMHCAMGSMMRPDGKVR